MEGSEQNALNKTIYSDVSHGTDEAELGELVVDGH